MLENPPQSNEIQIEHDEYNITKVQEFNGTHIYFRNQSWFLLGMIRYNVTYEDGIRVTIFVNDTVSAYKYTKNCSERMQKKLVKLHVSNDWIPWFWKIMTEILLRHLRKIYEWKRIWLNFVSLDRKKNQEALCEMVYAVADKCSDICTNAGGWNDEICSATLQLWIKD